MDKKLTEDQQGVAELISLISEEHYCAGWLMSIEFELWDYVAGVSSPKSPLGLHPPNSGLIKLLKYGSEMIGGWIRHTDADGRVFVPLDQWEELYAKRNRERANLPEEESEWRSAT